MEENMVEKLIKLRDYEELDKKSILLDYQNNGVCFINENGKDIMYHILGVAIDEGNWYVKVSSCPDKWINANDIYIVRE